MFFGMIMTNRKRKSLLKITFFSLRNSFFYIFADLKNINQIN